MSVDWQYGKKIAATILIVLFSLMLLSANASLVKAPKGDIAYLIGQLIGVVLVVLGLIFSIRWRVRLAGYQQTAGRQALAIFLIAFLRMGTAAVHSIGCGSAQGANYGLYPGNHGCALYGRNSCMRSLASEITSK